MDRKQMSKAFRDRAFQIDENMGNKRVFTYPFALRHSELIREGYFDGLTLEEFEQELDDFEMEYLRSEYPEEFNRREQQLIEEARLRALAMEPGKPEVVPSLEELINKTRENPNASVPIEVLKELRVGGRIRIL